MYYMCFDYGEFLLHHKIYEQILNYTKYKDE